MEKENYVIFAMNKKWEERKEGNQAQNSENLPLVFTAKMLENKEIKSARRKDY